jgi:hypothetical protein
MQVNQVLGSKLRRVPWLVKRIREQQKAIGKLGLFRNKHAGLTSSVRVSPKKEAPGNQLSQRGAGVSQALAVAVGITGTWRAEAPVLAERQIAAQDGESGFCEDACQGNQQR